MKYSTVEIYLLWNINKFDYKFKISDSLHSIKKKYYLVLTFKCSIIILYFIKLTNSFQYLVDGDVYSVFNIITLFIPQYVMILILEGFSCKVCFPNVFPLLLKKIILEIEIPFICLFPYSEYPSYTNSHFRRFDVADFLSFISRLLNGSLKTPDPPF